VTSEPVSTAFFVSSFSMLSVTYLRRGDIFVSMYSSIFVTQRLDKHNLTTMWNCWRRLFYVIHVVWKESVRIIVTADW
jgi:hypothetical protein